MNSGLFLSCIADPTRFAILNALANGDACVNDLVEMTEQSQSNISHHLKQLRECGFVQYERVGKSNLYSLATPTLQKFLQTVEETAEELATLCEVCP